MESLKNFIILIDDLLWSPIEITKGIPILGWLSPLAILLVGTGIWFTVKLGFIQIRGFKKGFKSVFVSIFNKSHKAGKDGMSSFQALATAVAAQVGTGNIVGASTAIAAGGPGAIFWMWLAAFFGMATIFAEATLAQKYKTTDKDGHIIGGPVYYIHEAFKGKFGNFLAITFSILIILSLGFMGNAVQSNGIASAWDIVFSSYMNIPKIEILGAKFSIILVIVGLLLALIAFLIFEGGIKAIASFTEKVVPIMAIIFIIGSLFVILKNFFAIPSLFYRIVVGAFNPKAVFGGAVGVMIKDAVSNGVARGLFSNEAGMGSTPHAHAVAKVDKPVDQGYVAMIGVFVDTFIILNLTAFVVIESGLYDPTVANAELTGAALAQAGFRTGMGQFGNLFIAICLTFFAFSTIISWYFFGEANIKYLFGKKAVRIYAIFVCICIFLGSLQEVKLIWTMQDAFNGLMVIPNLIAIIALTNIVKSELKK